MVLKVLVVLIRREIRAVNIRYVVTETWDIT